MTANGFRFSLPLLLALVACESCLVSCYQAAGTHKKAKVAAPSTIPVGLPLPPQAPAAKAVAPNVASVAVHASEPSHNGIYLDEVKIYDEFSLENLLGTAKTNLAKLNTFDQGGLTSHLGTIQGSTTSQSQNTLQVTGPASGNASSPTLPSAPAYTLPSTYQTSAGDLLNEQLQLSLQTINLQLLLGGSLADQNRAKVTLGFPVNISVPPGFKYQGAVAEVEVSVCGPNYTEAESSLMLLLPQEKTYNVASLTSSTSSIGGGVVAGVVSVGGGLLRGHQTYYLVQDQDTLAMQRFPADKCASGKRPVTFAWQFRPVLGQRVVRDGLRQMFAQISVPKPSAAFFFYQCPTVVKVSTAWKRYDAQTRRVGDPISGTAEEHLLQPDTFDPWPAPSSVSAEDNGDGTLLVKARLASRTGSRVRIGQVIQDSTTAGFFQGRDKISFVASALSLATHGAQLLYQDGTETPFRNTAASKAASNNNSCPTGQAMPEGTPVTGPLVVDISQINAITNERIHATISGVFTHFAPDSTVTFDPAGVTVDVVTVRDPQHLEVDLTTSNTLGQFTPVVKTPSANETARGLGTLAVLTVVPGNATEIRPFNDTTSLVTLKFPRAQSCPEAESTELVLVDSKVYGLRDAPFYSKGDNHISLLVPNDQIRTNRQFIWKRLFHEGCDRTFDVRFTEPAPKVPAGKGSDFAITDIKYVSYTAGAAAAGAAAPTASDVTISYPNGGPPAVTASGLFMIGDGSRAITAVSPASGFPGETLPIVIAGVFTHFKTNGAAPQFTFSNPKISATPDLPSSDDTHLAARLVIDPLADPGPVNFTVTVGKEVAIGQAVFTVGAGTGPTVTLDHHEGGAGTITPVTITGTRTNFVAGTTKITFDKKGVEGTVDTVTPPAAMTAKITVKPGTPPGPASVTVKTGAETAGGTNQFTVTPVPASIKAVNPAAGRPGQTIPGVIITAEGTDFVNHPPSAVTFSNPGITASDWRVAGKTKLMVTLDIAAGAGLPPPTNTYAIYGSRLKDLKILVPTGVQIGPVNEETLVTFSLTDAQAKATKGLVLQHRGDPPVYRALPDPPAAGGGTTTAPKNSIDTQPKAGIPATQKSVPLTGSGMSQVVSVRYQDQPLGFTTNSDKALTLQLPALAPPGIDVIFVYADKTMIQYFIPVQKPGS